MHLKPVRDEGAGADRERVYSAMQCPIKYWDRGANQNTLLTFDPGEQYIGVLKRKGKIFHYKNYLCFGVMIMVLAVSLVTAVFKSP